MKPFDALLTALLMMPATPAAAQPENKQTANKENPATSSEENDSGSVAFGSALVGFGSQSFEQFGFGISGGLSEPRLGKNTRLYYGGRAMYFLGSDFLSTTSRVQSLAIGAEAGVDFPIPLGGTSLLTIRATAVVGLSHAWITDTPFSSTFGLLSPGGGAILNLGPVFAMAELRLPIHTFGSLNDVDDSTLSLAIAGSVGLRL